MPRTARKKSETGIYHIILRGINRQVIFEDEEDSLRFLQALDDYRGKSGYILYAYVLMGNHIHLLLKEGCESIGITLKRLGASFVYWYNLKYDRCGHLFQDRYKSEPVDNDRYLLTVMRYIHCNPVKADLVADAADYRWSSYGEYVGKQNIVDTNFILGLFASDREKAIAEFQNFHKGDSDDDCLEIEDNKRLKDAEAIEVIKTACGVMSAAELQSIEKGYRDRYLKLLKKEGLSTRQIARLTGISRKIIIKA